MAQNATCTITYASVAGFPAGSVVDHIKVTCVGAVTGATTTTLQLAPGAPTAVFSSLAADTYTFTAQGFPLSGAGFGTAVTATLVVGAGATVSLSLPASMTAA
jgi:hypothetical protein